MTRSEQVGGKGMAEVVASHVLDDARPCYRLLESTMVAQPSGFTKGHPAFLLLFAQMV